MRLERLTAVRAEAKFRNLFSRSQPLASTAQNSGKLPFPLVHSRLVAATGVEERNLLLGTGTNLTVLDVAVARMLGGKAGDSPGRSEVAHGHDLSRVRPGGSEIRARVAGGLFIDATDFQERSMT